MATSKYFGQTTFYLKKDLLCLQTEYSASCRLPMSCCGPNSLYQRMRHLIHALMFF